MTNYEVLYIISPKAEETAREELIARFQNVVTAAGGTAEVNKWGMRKLAYKIDFQTEGFYVLMSFASPAEIPAELERQMRITDSVMRFMVTKKVENKLTRAEEEKKAKAAEKAAAAAKAREEAAAAAAIEAAEAVTAEVSEVSEVAEVAEATEAVTAEAETEVAEAVAETAEAAEATEPAVEAASSETEKSE